jgi:hypothetical protein
LATYVESAWCIRTYLQIWEHDDLSQTQADWRRLAVLLEYGNPCERLKFDTPSPHKAKSIGRFNPAPACVGICDGGRAGSWWRRPAGPVSGKLQDGLIPEFRVHHQKNSALHCRSMRQSSPIAALLLFLQMRLCKYRPGDTEMNC